MITSFNDFIGGLPGIPNFKVVTGISNSDSFTLEKFDNCCTPNIFSGRNIIRTLTRKIASNYISNWLPNITFPSNPTSALYTPNKHSTPDEMLFDGQDTSPSEIPKFHKASSFNVELDQIISIETISSWSGHVFNLETESNQYIANGILVSNCCRGHITKSIEQTKPKFIIGLGIPAQEWVLGSSDQIGMRGRVFAVKIGNHSCYFLPTYHPSRVNRAAGEQAKKQGRDPFNISHAELLRSFSGRTFKFDLDKAFELAKSLEPPIIETETDIRKRIITFDRNEDFDQLLALLARAKQAPHKAIDIETDRLRPYGKIRGILSIGISFNNTNFSFSVDHPSSHWAKSQRDRILAIVADIISDDTIKIAHNACFELEWFIHYFGKEVVNHTAWECTQLQAHFLDERRGARQFNDDSKRATYQSLHFLVKQHFAVAFKPRVDVDRNHMAHVTLVETLIYNPADRLFCLRLWHK